MLGGGEGHYKKLGEQLLFDEPKSLGHVMILKFFSFSVRSTYGQTVA